MERFSAARFLRGRFLPSRPSLAQCRHWTTTMERGILAAFSSFRSRQRSRLLGYEGSATRLDGARDRRAGAHGRGLRVLSRARPAAASFALGCQWLSRACASGVARQTRQRAAAAMSFASPQRRDLRNESRRVRESTCQHVNSHVLHRHPHASITLRSLDRIDERRRACFTGDRRRVPQRRVCSVASARAMHIANGKHRLAHAARGAARR
jgi:hypothetical protein